MKLLSGETVNAAKPFNVNVRSTNGIDAVHGDKGKKGKHVTGKKGKGQGQRQRKSTWVNKRAARSLRATVVTVESGRHKQKDCGYNDTVAEVDEEETAEHPNSNASSSTHRVTPPPHGLSSTGTAQL